MDELEKTLAAVASGQLSVESAAGRLKRGEVRYLDEFAALDLGRSIRKGVPEVVYASGKSPSQVASICATLLESCERVIVSTPTPEHEATIRATLPETQLRWAGRSLVIGSGEPAPSGGRVGALSAGTSDLPVLEEALAVAGDYEARVRAGRASPFLLAVVYAGLGDKDAAFHWLEKSYEDRSNWMALLKVGRRLAPLHTDPRFRSLVERVGFPNKS